MSKSERSLKRADVSEIVRNLNPNLTEDELTTETDRLLGIIADVILELQVPPENKGVPNKTSQQ
jgi:hypothetical protein